MGVVQADSKATASGDETPLVPRSGRTVAWSELRKHNTRDDVWIAIAGQVYDVTQFARYAAAADER